MQVLISHLKTINQEGQQAHPGARLQPVEDNVQDYPKEGYQLQKGDVA
jgi:hypothetical protein